MLAWLLGGEDLDCWVGQYDGLTAPTPVPKPQSRKRRKLAPKA